MEKIIYILILIILDNNFYKDIKTINHPASIDILVNKNISLNKNYIPYDLEPINLEFSCRNNYLKSEARIAFENMAMNAKKENLNLIAVSTYRSYKYQEKLYNKYVKEKGINYANLCSAKAGHSEHQTGLAIDIADNTLDYDNFLNTKEFIWIKNNAFKYGFILRYPKSKFHITGFKFEPWHIRYVGNDIAKYIHKNNITLEEYNNLKK